MAWCLIVRETGPRAQGEAATVVDLGLPSSRFSIANMLEPIVRRDQANDKTAVLPLALVLAAVIETGHSPKCLQKIVAHTRKDARILPLYLVLKKSQFLRIQDAVQSYDGIIKDIQYQYPVEL
jgi:hypothetical protein